MDMSGRQLGTQCEVGLAQPAEVTKKTPKGLRHRYYILRFGVRGGDSSNEDKLSPDNTSSWG